MVCWEKTELVSVNCLLFRLNILSNNLMDIIITIYLTAIK